MEITQQQFAAQYVRSNKILYDLLALMAHGAVIISFDWKSGANVIIEEILEKGVLKPWRKNFREPAGVRPLLVAGFIDRFGVVQPAGRDFLRSGGRPA